MNSHENEPKRKRRRGAKARLEAQLRSFSVKTSSTRGIEKKLNLETNTDSKPNTCSTHDVINTKRISSLPSTATTITASKKKMKKKGKYKKQIPKPGEEGYLTPTQLRNARKRRAKQSIRHSFNSDDKDNQNDSSLHHGHQTQFDNSSKKRNLGLMKQETESVALTMKTVVTNVGSITFSKNDPSMRYIKFPRKAPAVKSAVCFFQDHPTFQSKKKIFKVVLGPLFGWRTVSKLAVRKSDTENKVLIGLFTPKTHSILPIPNCPAHHQSINHATSAIQLACESCKISPYDEHSGKGNLRYVCINVERITGKTQITLVWNSDKSLDLETKDESILQNFVKNIIEMGTCDRGNRSNKESIESFSLHSLWVHRNSTWKHSNAIFDITAPMNNNKDSSWKLEYGPDVIEECILPFTEISRKTTSPTHEIKLRFPPNVFRQANIDAFAKIVQRIRDRIIEFNEALKSTKTETDPPSKPFLPSILELYGGVGTIGLHVADLASSIICSDENIHNPKCFEGSVSQCLPSNIAQNCTYIRKNAADMIACESGLHLDRADIIIVDPPRKGLEDTVLDGLVSKSMSQGEKSHTKLLVYVSCGFDAFQQNCKRLEGEGRWVLQHAEGHILFPGSDAIETLAFFVC